MSGSVLGAPCGVFMNLPAAESPLGALSPCLLPSCPWPMFWMSPQPWYLVTVWLLSGSFWISLRIFSVNSIFSLKNPELCLFTHLQQTDFLPNHLPLINILALFIPIACLSRPHSRTPANTLCWWLSNKSSDKHRDCCPYCFSRQIISFDEWDWNLTFLPSQTNDLVHTPPSVLHQFPLDSASGHFGKGDCIAPRS